MQPSKKEILECLAQHTQHNHLPKAQLEAQAPADAEVQKRAHQLLRVERNPLPSAHLPFL